MQIRTYGKIGMVMGILLDSNLPLKPMQLE